MTPQIFWDKACSQDDRRALLRDARIRGAYWRDAWRDLPLHIQILIKVYLTQGLPE